MLKDNSLLLLKNHDLAIRKGLAYMELYFSLSPFKVFFFKQKV